jgi:nucleoside permease NupC
MDPAKLRLFYGIAGGLTALVGFSALAVAFAVALAAPLGWAGAVVATALVFLVTSGILMVLCLKPTKPAEAELHQLEEATSQALADLPFDTFQSVVNKRPITVAIGAMVVGYMVFRNPGNALKAGQRILSALL